MHYVLSLLEVFAKEVVLNENINWGVDLHNKINRA